MSKITKLEDSQTWKDANYVAEYVYSKIIDMPAEEEWNTTTKLKTAANNLLFSVSEAIGANLSYIGAQYDWPNVRKHASSLKTMYRFATKQKFIEMEPGIMVILDSIIKTSESEFELSQKNSIQREIDEAKQWQKKYSQWKEMQK